MNSLLFAVQKNEAIEQNLSAPISSEANLQEIFEAALFDRLPQEKIAQLIIESPKAAENELSRVINELMATRQFASFSYEKQQNLREEVLARFLGLGPLEGLLNDHTVSEIMVNGPKNIFYERAGKLFRSDRTFSSDEDVRQLIDQIIAPLGRRLDESNPVVNARLKEGHRVHAIIPPLALDGPTITIRKFRNETFTLEDLAELDFLPMELVPLLRAVVKARKNIAVSGGTGSGKTTFLNTLSQEISSRERIITIEDSAELRFAHHPHVVRLESRAANLEGEGAITLRELVINSLRMRPDRIVVGEVRGSEALEMLQAMNTGHDGSMTTLHANSEHEVAGRLVTMVGYGAQLSAAQVLEQVASALDIIIQLARRRDGLRFVVSISLVVGVKEGKLQLAPLYYAQNIVNEASHKFELKSRYCSQKNFCRSMIDLGLLSETEAAPWLS